MLELIDYSGEQFLCILQTPIHDLCPITHEPQEGSYITIQYYATTKLLGLRAVQHYVQSIADKPLDIETVLSMLCVQLSQSFDNFEIQAHVIMHDGITLDIQKENG